MVKRIDFFLYHHESFPVEPFFVDEFCAAWERRGVHCRKFPIEMKGSAEYLRSLLRDPPDFTCCFAGKFTPPGNTTSQVMGIPHLYYFVDSAIYGNSLWNDPGVIFSCIDQLELQHLKESQPQLNLLFLPQATAIQASRADHLERPYEVVFIGNCIDYETIRAHSREFFAPNEYELIERSVEEVLFDPARPFFKAILDQIDDETKEDSRKLHWLWRYCEDISRGLDRISLIRSISCAKVHLFGRCTIGRRDWSSYLGDRSNVVVHPTLPYDEGLKLFEQSKIVLNSTPQYKRGAHERVFTGMARGALMVTNDNPLMRQIFEPDEELLLYHHPDLHLLDEQINSYLSHFKKWQETAERGRKKVLCDHTWDARVECCLQQLPTILDHMAIGR